MSDMKKFLDYEGVKFLWSKISMQDYPNNETLMAVINAIDETKADKEDLAQAVLYTTQSLTDEQKAQARANIGAAKISEINKTFVIDYALPLKLTLQSLGINGKTLVGGTAKFADIEIIDNQTFLYKINTMCFDDCDNIKLTFSDGSVDDSVTIVPATTIYYETDFAPGVFTTTDDWTMSKTVDGDVDPDYVQDNGVVGKNHTYGYDSSYSNDKYLSNGSSLYVEGQGYDKDKNADGTYTYIAKTYVTFSFKGTGFDLISRIGEKQGLIKVEVFSDEAMKTAVKTVSISSKSELELYQIPLVSINDLPYNFYYVRISVDAAFKNETGFPALDVYNRGNEFYFDAIRIYNPANNGEDNSIIRDAYQQDGEGWPAYRKLTNAGISADDFNNLNDEATIDNIVFIDNCQVSSYNSNALLLTPGQAIAFSLDLDGLKNTVASVQVGLKCVSDIDVDCKIFDGELIEFRNDLNKISDTTLKTCTDMYYNISQYKDGLIVIYNNSKDNKILMPTTLKVTFNNKLEDEASIKFKTCKRDICKFIESLRTEIATVGFVNDKVDIATDDEIIEMLAEIDMFPVVTDSDGALLSDENENILLW